ncbi:TetR/AcrR family transcriptional regulator [Actinokineospora sp. PR83]|uniref:TetR/AcrR family transcriptional regulator C-terminal domain-containing protein n=1 Tax=Actinokineospora sp. PR83 TaxID=2884908 RepID=UPI0027DFDDA8|nr:TetR/AcrR family transcriptional regulator C-terminal domain-containing protein [Actinokineospora sp. PR83]MCG8918813.1 TetR/AcrR family transcriptional regulator [Actinokineospora sp. PR83]
MSLPKRAKTGGRTAQVSPGGIVAAGVRVGLAGLTVQAVAAELGVTSTAVYRRVPSRQALERLVGEAVLADLVITDDPTRSTTEHLVSFAGELRAFTLAHPGAAAYFQRVFPRGASGVRLLEAEVAALGNRGYAPEAAVVLSSAVARTALGHAAAQEAREAAAAANPDAAGAEVEAALAAVASSPVLAAAHARIPITSEERQFHLLMTATVAGLVAALPPGRPLDEVLPG